MPDGTTAVLKLLAVPEDAPYEVSALAAWAGSGRAVSVIDADVSAGAVLLQHIEPATPLALGVTATAVSVAADLCRHIHISPPAAIPRFETRYHRYEQRSLDDARYEQEVLGNIEPPGVCLLPVARAAAFRLSTRASSNVLLHGDFCDKNILLNNRQYVVIDPMPMVGDPCSDVGFFVAYHPPASSAFECAARIAIELDYDPGRCEMWTAVWLTHQACESWRDDSEDLYAWAHSTRAHRLLTSL